MGVELPALFSLSCSIFFHYHYHQHHHYYNVVICQHAGLKHINQMCVWHKTWLIRNQRFTALGCNWSSNGSIFRIMSLTPCFPALGYTAQLYPWAESQVCYFHLCVSFPEKLDSVPSLPSSHSVERLAMTIREKDIKDPRRQNWV